MQTFVPYPDFVNSAAVLDSRRLGKQRVETFQILRALVWPSYAWKNHPATRMWRGFVPALVSYGVATCKEWEARGHAEGMVDSLLEFTGGTAPTFAELVRDGALPPWFGHDPVHRSHQSSLVRKEPEHYREFFPDVPDDLPYVWPAAAFPHWPLRRGHDDALPLDEALALLGHDEAREPQRAAVEAAAAHRDLHLVLAPGAGTTTAGLLAGLCTPGQTLWVSEGPVLGELPTPPRPTTPLATGGKVSLSIAKAADEAAALAMTEEAGSRAEFRFLRPEQLTPDIARGAGLVVVEDSHGRGDIKVPDVGLPVLRLETDPTLEPVPPPKKPTKKAPKSTGVSATEA